MPGEVGRPDVSPVAGAAIVGHHGGERPVERVGVDADHAHPLLDQPQRALAAQARLGEIVGRVEALVGAGLQQHDVERPQLIVDLAERLLAGRRP